MNHFAPGGASVTLLHRARAAGGSLEAVAFYLGHITRKGTLAIQTTARYTHVSREDIKQQIAAVGSYVQLE